jgi:hypothetical protein
MTVSMRMVEVRQLEDLREVELGAAVELVRRRRPPAAR